MPAKTLQVSVGTSAVQVQSSSQPNRWGIEIEGLPANSDNLYLGFSDQQLLIYGTANGSAGNFVLRIVDLNGTSYSLTCAYNITAAALQTAIRAITVPSLPPGSSLSALATPFPNATVTGAGGLVIGQGVTINLDGTTGGRRYPLVTTDISGLTIGAGGTLSASYSTSLTTSNGFAIAAGSSYRVTPEEETDISQIWLISGTASQTACCIAS